MPAIETTALTKRYGDSVLAVDDLDLTVDDGEIFGFLGPNGAGKSTTLNMLLDFVRPTSGSVTVLGYDAQTEIHEIRKRIGVLPEGATLYERLTAREHVEWVADTKNADPDVDALLERVGILEDADRAAGGFSKGMRQRLGLGMALVGEPDLLLLDEPSSGLDPAGMQEMREILREEADRGTTVFFSSHILGEVEAVCDRIGIMSEGTLVTTGTIDDLQGELDLGASISLEVASVPEDLALESLEGVRSVAVEGTTITATCVDPAVKVDVVERVAAATAVEDIISEDASLEELFNTYTHGRGRGRNDSEAAPDEPVRTAEVEA
ncbi:ABC transporter ATP-binding protein [Natronolimnohabitans innermongolicus]|uniref:ABC transporter n=1 Tax=Natronolimnohabitans innermongolicus JCM 12255 TaxID=1227499 RepID=L9WX75_9EURY|nr:ABC transporter ATP-binding protein [Natronolimnohabitans innermongolicus]ELY54074.1 ABC transporter [Natronolimnohabitans innermongolicus JCM 12255]